MTSVHSTTAGLLESLRRFGIRILMGRRLTVLSGAFAQHGILNDASSDISFDSQTGVPGADNGLGPVSDLQLAENVRNVILHRFCAQQ